MSGSVLRSLRNELSQNSIKSQKSREKPEKFSKSEKVRWTKSGKVWWEFENSKKADKKKNW